MPPPKITEVERATGENCASLIEDGSTLQLGIGSLPEAVLLFLKDKKDQGIHSEMLSDGIVELIEAGVVTNKMKTLHKGKAVVSFLMGTRRLYDFVDDNPMIYMAPGGKSIIAIPSTTGGGKVSKIVPFLDQGAAVTTNRNDVRYIVTEYGIAYLQGKTLRDRARELINIAHPNFRPQLIEEWERRFHSKF